MKIDTRLSNEQIRFQLQQMPKYEIIDILLEYVDMHRSIRKEVMSEIEKQLDVPTSKQISNIRYYEDNKERYRMQYLARKIRENLSINDKQIAELEALAEKYNREDIKELLKKTETK